MTCLFLYWFFMKHIEENDFSHRKVVLNERMYITNIFISKKLSPIHCFLIILQVSLVLLLWGFGSSEFNNTYLIIPESWCKIWLRIKRINLYISNIHFYFYDHIKFTNFRYQSPETKSLFLSLQIVNPITLTFISSD